MHPKFWLENLKRRDHLEELGVDGRIILEWILKKQGIKMLGWIHLAPDKYQWWAFLNMIMNLWVR